MGSPHDDDRLIGWLHDHDEACPACGYSLKGLADALCPECGAPLRLSVVSPNAQPGPWALAVISFALALGFDAVVTAFMTGAFIFVAGLPPLMSGGLIYLGFIALTLASGVGLVVSFRHRSWWTRQPRAHQWRASRLIFVIVGAIHSAFGLVLALNMV